MTLPGELGSGQAQVLAAIIRRTGRGPVTFGQLARDTGLTRIRVERIVARLDALDLIALTGEGPVTRVWPVAVDEAASRGAGSVGAEEQPALTDCSPFHIGPSPERPDGQ